MNHQELIERMRGFEIDHDPDGWPAIRMRDISAMCDAIESLLNALDVAEGEFGRTAAERDAALAELAKYRDAEMGEDSDSEQAGYWCVVCGRFLRADEFGVIVHDDKPHPESMTFEEPMQ